MLFLWILSATASCIICTLLGKEKFTGKMGGFALGFFLGIIGLLILLFLPKIDKSNSVNSQKT